MKQQYHEVFITDSGETTVFRWRVEHPLRPMDEIPTAITSTILEKENQSCVLVT